MANIVIIEDTPANLELMSYLLGAFSHNIFTAADGDEGLALVRRIRPDLIICDVHLPKADGYEVAKALKADAALASVPLLAVTALAMVGDREKGMAAGFDGYLYKPIEPETFVADVERFLNADYHGISPLRQLLPEISSAGLHRRKCGKILVVDDSLFNRELSRDMLEPMGYEVWLAESADMAYALACQSMPDLILSDLHMPGKDGFALFRQLKENFNLSVIPFVIFSASTIENGDREIAESLGAVSFLMRPIEPAAFLDEIEEILAQRQRSV